MFKHKYNKKKRAVIKNNSPQEIYNLLGYLTTVNVCIPISFPEATLKI